MPRTGYAREWDTPAAIAAREMVYTWSPDDRQRNAGFLLGRVGLRFMERTERDILRSLCDWLSIRDLQTGALIVTTANAEISEDVGVKERTVIEGLSRLERDGWIRRDWTDKHRRYGGAAGIDLTPLYCRLNELQLAFEDRNRSRRITCRRAARPHLSVAVDNTSGTTAGTEQGAQLGASMGVLGRIPHTETANSSINLEGCSGLQGDNRGDKSSPGYEVAIVRRTVDPDAAFDRLRVVMRSIDPDLPLRRRHNQAPEDAALLATLELAASLAVRRQEVVEAIRRQGAISALAALVVVKINLANGRITRSPSALAIRLLREASVPDLWRTINHALARTLADRNKRE